MPHGCRCAVLLRVVRLILPALICLATWSWVVAPCPAATGATITVEAGVRTHPVNRLLFGQNILFASNSLWNTRNNGTDPGAAPLVKAISPTIVRFPGGTASDIYLWEDGLGYRTIAPVTTTSSTILLDGSPRWETVHKARLLDACGGPLGTPFTFLRLAGTRIEGVMGLKGSHQAGAVVRPEARAGQPEYFANNYGIMEHMAFVRSLGAQAMLTVNYCTGLDRQGRLCRQASLGQKVKRAAALVALVNGKPGDPRPLGTDDEGHDWHTVGYWAQKRAAGGHPEPYAVRYWEVGNEVSDRNNVGGFVAAQQYARDFVAFAQAMKTVDPTIKIGAVGMTFPRGKGDADLIDPWNPTVVKIAHAGMDFLVIHPYYPAAGQERASYQSQKWFTAVMAGAAQAMADLQEIRAVIQENAAPGESIDLAITEYGIWPAASKDPRDYANLARTLYDADLLMGLLRDGPGLGISLATAWNLHGSNPTAAIRYDWNTGTRLLRPHYHAMKLLVNHVPPHLVATRVTSPTFPVEQVGNVKAAAAVPLITAMAATSPDGRHLTLVVLNRALSQPVIAAIRLQGFSPQPTAQVMTLSGHRVSDHNEDQPHAVEPAVATIANAAPSFSYTFGARSLTLLQFQGQP